MTLLQRYKSWEECAMVTLRIRHPWIAALVSWTSRNWVAITALTAFAVSVVNAYVVLKMGAIHYTH